MAVVLAPCAKAALQGNALRFERWFGSKVGRMLTHAALHSEQKGACQTERDGGTDSHKTQVSNSQRKNLGCLASCRVARSYLKNGPGNLNAAITALVRVVRHHCLSIGTCPAEYPRLLLADGECIIALIICE